MSQQSATLNEEEFSPDAIVEKYDEDQLIVLRHTIDNQLEKLRKNKLVEAQEEIQRIASRLGYNSPQALLEATQNAKAPTKSTKATTKEPVRRTATPKYYNPNNKSQTWSGRGKVPIWLNNLVKDGNAKLEDFLIPQDLIDTIKSGLGNPSA